MTDSADTTGPEDGRVARRQRNINTALDAVMEMFAEESLFPTIEQVASRSGLSLRSLYRYFANPSELLEAAIRRTVSEGYSLAQLDTPGEGPFEQRLEDFVEMRLRVHKKFGDTQRAALANAGRYPAMAKQLTQGRNAQREQFAKQFAPELETHKGKANDTVLTAGDLLTQIQSIDYMRRHRNLSDVETKEVLTESLRSLLT